MRRDEHMYIFGEDVGGNKGGVFTATTGIAAEFGKERCFQFAAGRIQRNRRGYWHGPARHAAGCGNPVWRLYLDGHDADS